MTLAGCGRASGMDALHTFMMLRQCFPHFALENGGSCQVNRQSTVNSGNTSQCPLVHHVSHSTQPSLQGPAIYSLVPVLSLVQNLPTLLTFSIAPRWSSCEKLNEGTKELESEPVSHRLGRELVIG